MFGFPQDLTGFTEVDPNSRVEKTTTRVTSTNVGRNEAAYVYKDKGANWFSGNFKHRLDIRVTGYSGSSPLLVVWALANVVSDRTNGTWGGAGIALDAFVIYNKTSGTYVFYLEEYEGTPYQTTFNLLQDTTYYLEIERKEEVGTYGTLYCRIYSSAAAREAGSGALATLSLALHAKRDFRYYYAMATSNVAAAVYISGYAENVDLGERRELIGRGAFREFASRELVARGAFAQRSSRSLMARGGFRQLNGYGLTGRGSFQTLSYTKVTIPLTISRLSSGAWRFEWDAESGETYEAWLDGVLLERPEDGIFECQAEGYLDEPPPVEIVKTGESENEEHPPYLLLQWKRLPTATAYVIEQYVGSAWVTKQYVMENGSAYYQHRTPAGTDGALNIWRVKALNSIGDAGTPIEFQLLLVRNPAPPEVAVEYESTGDLVVSEA